MAFTNKIKNDYTPLEGVAIEKSNVLDDLNSKTAIIAPFNHLIELANSAKEVFDHIPTLSDEQIVSEFDEVLRRKIIYDIANPVDPFLALAKYREMVVNRIIEKKKLAATKTPRAKAKSEKKPDKTKKLVLSGCKKSFCEDFCAFIIESENPAKSYTISGTDKDIADALNLIIEDKNGNELKTSTVRKNFSKKKEEKPLY